MKQNAWLLLAISAVLAQGCAIFDPQVPDPGGPGGGDDVGDPGDPVDPVDPGLEPVTDGTYELSTTFDVTAGVLAPGQLHDALVLLEDFRAEPSATLVVLLDDAGVPLLADLLDVLPGALEDRLLGWIDEHIDQALADSGAGAVIDDILALAQTSLGQFDAISQLELGDGTGEVEALHRIAALAFALQGAEYAVQVPAVPGATEVPALARLTLDGGVDGAALEIGDHVFGLPYGDYAYAALEAWMQAEHGADLRGALGGWVDCPALAASVADRCVLGVCVGHEQELLQICEQGLDLAVAEIQGRFAAMRFDALRLAEGLAVLRDDGADGVADAITDGVWQAQIDAGMGPRDIPAVFAGARLP